ncbi:MAG: T9SS type A sorting domain-containing protein [Winogradskyella sp.]|uniref:T9SS type A sorting domain-containing protein n=1 Tax=Winogradskyella sp. TaxID=1883156 RepID=UPI00385C6A4A
MKLNLLHFFIALFAVLSSYAQVANGPQIFEVCDDTSNDGFYTFDLAIISPQILGSQDPSLFNVSYFITQADADSNSNQLPFIFTNFTNPQTIYATVTDVNTANFDTTTVTLIINPAPVIVEVTPLEACDPDNNGFTVFDLQLKVDELLNGQDPSVFIVSFHETESAAIIGNDTVTLLYGNIVQSIQTIYARVADLNTNCAAITTFDLLAISCPDTDSDGVIDSDEDLNNNGNLDDDDSDDDTIPNYLDTDDDGDNVDTIVEINETTERANTIHSFVDTDNDLIENYLDNDDDGDGILTIDEDYNNNGDPTDDDTNNNTVPDYLESAVALSLNEFITMNFSVFPNPAKDEFTIQLTSSYSEIGNLTIYNIQGKMILKDINVDGNRTIVDISSLESGLYFAELTVGNASTVQKLIVD